VIVDARVDGKGEPSVSCNKDEHTVARHVGSAVERMLA